MHLECPGYKLKDIAESILPNGSNFIVVYWTGGKVAFHPNTVKYDGLELNGNELSRISSFS